MFLLFKRHLVLLLFISQSLIANNLFDTYQLAKKNDRSYQAVLANHQANLEKKPQLISYLLPNISANINKTNTYGDDKNKDNNTNSLTISQTIFNKATLNGLTQADLAISQSQLTLTQSKQALMLQVTNAYFGVLQASDILESVQKETLSIKQQLVNIQQKFKVGLETSASLLEVQAKYDLIIANVFQAETSEFIAKEKLYEITNDPQQTLMYLKTDILLENPNPNSVDEWVTLALQQNLALNIQQLKVEFAREEISLQRAGHYPKVSLSATKKEISSDSGSDDTNDILALQINIPIFSGGLTASKVREAQHKFSAAKNELAQTRRETTRKIRGIYFTIHSNIKQIKATERSLQSATAALKADKLGFEAGVRTTTDVLNSQSQFFKAKLNLTKLRYSYLTNHLSLKQMAGILSDKDLKKTDTFLLKN